MSSRADRGGEHRRLGPRVLLSVVPLAAAATLLGLGAGGGGASARPGRGASAGAATATVERRTLVEREEVDGTLGFGKPSPVFNRGQGTITRLAAPGSVVERNGVLYELDGRPVRLLHGEVPAYRRLASGVGPGVDVQQLEANLQELGHAKGLLSKADTTWDEATTAAVKRWQKATGADQDGVVEDGEVVFLPAAARISSHEAQPGSPASPAAVLQVTGTSRQVSIDLDARKQRLAQQGAEVEVEMPDGTTARGRISTVGTVAESKGGDGSGGSGKSKPTLAVTVALEGPGTGGNLDGAPVAVRLVRSTREEVLAVPVQALLALAEGGYGVEVADGALRRLRRVETGLFAEGMVEVSGEGLAAGMRVVTAG